MTDTALPRLVRRSPVATALVVLLTFLVGAIAVSHAVPVHAVTPSIAA